jgi:hypothetical protein
MASKLNSLEALIQLAMSRQAGNDAFCDLVLQEIRTGRRKLALLSMWKRPLSAPVAPHLGASTAEASAKTEVLTPFGERAT